MKTIKTSELTGAALDWAVAICEGEIFSPLASSCHYFAPSRLWAQGGPIIERAVICVGSGLDAPTWYANMGLCKNHHFGPTPLIAAMRCYVASKLGDTIEIPEELT